MVVQGALQALGPLTWTAGPGEVLGAHAVLSRTSQQAGFRATEPCLVAYAGVQQTRTLLAGSPAFAAAVAVALSAELDRSLGMRAGQQRQPRRVQQPGQVAKCRYRTPGTEVAAVPAGAAVVGTVRRPPPAGPGLGRGDVLAGVPLWERLKRSIRLRRAIVPLRWPALLISRTSGKTNRHRLNRAGDRRANASLWHIVIVRLSRAPAHPRLPLAKAPPLPPPSEHQRRGRAVVRPPASGRWLGASGRQPPCRGSRTAGGPSHERPRPSRCRTRREDSSAGLTPAVALAEARAGSLNSGGECGHHVLISEADEVRVAALRNAAGRAARMAQLPAHGDGARRKAIRPHAA